MSLRAYQIVTKCLDPIAPALVSLFVRGRDEERGERLGRYRTAHAPGAVWVHAASAGETEGADPIVREVRRALPGAPIVLSSVTRAGKARAERIGAARSIYAPLDFPRAVRSALHSIRPSALLLVETEIWPNLVRESARASIPVAVVNGRISARAFRRMGLVRGLYRAVLSDVARVGVQRAVDRERFAFFGVPEERIFICGNTKLDTESPEPRDPGLRKSREERWVVFGSVRPGEEEPVLGAVRAVLASSERNGVVVVPRHPDRAGPYLQAKDIPWKKWSETGAGAGRAVLVDTIGELLAFYRMADVAYVGGSLSRHGGHNPVEPARFGVPVLMGPHRENCRDLADLLERAGALEEAADGNALAAKMLGLLEDEAERKRRGEAGRAAVLAERGAAARCVRRLIEEGVLQAVPI